MNTMSSLDSFGWSPCDGRTLSLDTLQQKKSARLARSAIIQNIYIDKFFTLPAQTKTHEKQKTYISPKLNLSC